MAAVCRLGPGLSRSHLCELTITNNDNFSTKMILDDANHRRAIWKVILTERMTKIGRNSDEELSKTSSSKHVSFFFGTCLENWTRLAAPLSGKKDLDEVYAAKHMSCSCRELALA